MNDREAFEAWLHANRAKDLDLLEFVWAAWQDAIKADRQKRGEPVVRNWPELERLADVFIADYEMRGEDEEGNDACYTPSDGERDMIADAVRGLLADDAFTSALFAAPPVDQAMRERAKELAEKFERESDLSLNQGDPMYHDLIEAASLLKELAGL